MGDAILALHAMTIQRGKRSADVAELKSTGVSHASGSGARRKPDQRRDAARAVGLLTFLETAGREVNLSIDRSVARRGLYAVEGMDPRQPGAIDFYAAELSACGTACGMRIDKTALTVQEAMSLLRPSAPIGVLSVDAFGNLAWKLLVDHTSSRVTVYDSAQPDVSRLASPAELEQAVSEDGSEVRWLAVQSLLPCEDSNHGGRSDDTQSLLARYWRLLSPDWSDIWVILVFAVFVGIFALASPIAIEALVNTVAFGQFLQPVVVLALILATFMSFAAAMRATQQYVAEIIQQRQFVRIAADVANRLPRVSIGFWNHHYGPELLNRFFDVLTVQKVTTQLLLEGTALVLQTIVGLTVIAFYHPALLGFSLLLLLLVFAIVLLLGRGAVRTSVDESQCKYATAAWLEELARHPMAFRSRQGIEFAMDHIDRRLAAYVIARRAHFRVLFRQVIAALSLEVVASTVLLGLGGWLVIRGELTLGQLVAAELIVSTIVRSYAKIGKHLESFYDVMAATNKLEHLFHMPLDSFDGVELPADAAPLSVSIGGLVMESTPDAAVHRGASFELAPGEAAAITGSSAKFRAELMQAIVGLRKPVAGQVLLDGIDARRLRGESLRDQIALIGDAEIFHGSVAENLHVGRTNVGEAEIRQALTKVGLLEEVQSLPDGLDCMLETEGEPLTRDQAVRLMLARAMLGRPRLMLIDGALDGLPDDQLPTVLENLTANAGTWTLLIGTGRRDVAEACGRVYRLAANGNLEADSP